VSNATDTAIRYSKANMQRMAAMESALRVIDENNIEGDIVECGVWRGGHIILARIVSPFRVCWLYDTFDGMTPPGPFDRKTNGKMPPKKALNHHWTRATLEEVMGNFCIEGLYDQTKLVFVVGDVAKTLLDHNNLPDKIALLRLDTDWYESTKIELEVLFPRIVPGGILIVDDYGHWQGARKAVDEYLGHRVSKLDRIDYTAVMMTV